MRRMWKKAVTAVGTTGLAVGLAVATSTPAHAIDGVNQYGGSCRLSANWGVWFSYDWNQLAAGVNVTGYLNYAVARSDGPLELNGASEVVFDATDSTTRSAPFRYTGRTADGQYLYRADPDRGALDAVAIATAHPTLVSCESNTTVIPPVLA
jgi:hypothetical protein